ncbi:Helicase associated domain protein [Kitasatospora sp. NPDC049285]|uniref:DEAD/DEAH box helicase n=1 Tax=Kitasatospora sp. NPDC049285 TaxID=3157096 RepID=UPI00343FD016
MTIAVVGELVRGRELGPVRLRAHQEEAVAAVVRGLTLRPGQVTPGGLRVTVQMATGTGKSFVGAVAAQRLAPHGAVLVVVPTLDLLVQMAASWREAGRKGAVAAVCSLVDSELPSGMPASTHPLVIGRWMAERRGPLTLFATYASAGAVADAYAAWAEVKGEALAAVDLMVCDEAHRSSGSAEKRWTLVHHQSEIPAARRLYMTATPRIWMPPKSRVRGREGAYQPLTEELAVSMDDQRLFGRQVFTLGLAEAVDKELLAPFEIVVLELRDPLSDRKAARQQPVPWGPGAGEAKDGSQDAVPVERIAAIQAGLLKTAAELGLERTITFHTRTLEAQYFSETLNQTAERLHLENPGAYPAEVWSQWLSGEHPVDYRKDILSDFGRTAADDGLTYRVMANCRVLGEGVDLPGCDSILLQGRGSMVDIVQAVGRALRMKPGEGKLARIIVPVFLREGEEPGDILESDSYGPLVRILAALRSHDARVVEALAVPQNGGRRTHGRSAEWASAPGEGAEGGAGGGVAGAFTLPVRFQSEVSADVLALFVATRVLTGENAYWREAIGHCQKWFEEHGSLDVPYAQMVGEQGNYPLGKWLSDRRSDRANGDLPDYRVEQLDGMGMVWSVSDARFEAGLSWARVWAAEHGGSLAAPARASIGGYQLGTWLVSLRTAAEVPAGEPGALSPERRRALEEIDPWWCPAWPITWQRAYAAARAWWLEWDGEVDWAHLPESTVFEGEQLGRWVLAQRAGHPGLVEEQQELLAAIGIEAEPELVAAAAVKAERAAARPRISQADRFAHGVAALAQFVQREGHARPRRTHRERLELVSTGPGGEDQVQMVDVGLGAWLTNTKSRREKLTAGQLAQLAEHGVEWA